ncbi:hypothetical protein PF004_g30589 [Phytophthora fragariae]|uniref:Pol Polyprotein n=1 Tax=Phytophthora fragariae TaxID=53985 RepID=A0A6G0MCQ8_9STRA|nr:hypothetical protein PF004_g30589 [Phytophthora fragariae]
MKVNGEAYTLDIPTSLRLHPTFYVGRLKKYHAAAIPSMTNPPAPEQRARAPHDAQSAPQTGVVELPPVTPRRHASPARESAPAALDMTGAAPQAPSEPALLGRRRLSLHLNVPCTNRSLLQVTLGYPSVRATAASRPRRLLTRLVICAGS